jgi:hypothetical protein
MRVWGLLAALLLAGCSGSAKVGSLTTADAAPGALPVCHGYGCKLRTTVSLDQAQWDSVAASFVPLPQTAAEERAQIGRAIARIEELVAPTAGTSGDAGQNQLLASAGQLDCVDETVNTQTYLTLLERGGLLRFHVVASPAHRGWPDDTWVHNTAVVAEHSGSARYAIDSWFFENGRPAAVVPLQAWLDGWQPGDEPAAPAGSLAALSDGDTATAPPLIARAGAR